MCASDVTLSKKARSKLCKQKSRSSIASTLTTLDLGSDKCITECESLLIEDTTPKRHGPKSKTRRYRLQQVCSCFCKPEIIGKSLTL